MKWLNKLPVWAEALFWVAVFFSLVFSVFATIFIFPKVAATLAVIAIVLLLGVVIYISSYDAVVYRRKNSRIALGRREDK